MLQSYGIVLIFCVTATYCMIVNLWCFWKKQTGQFYNNNQTCNNVFVDNIMICNLFIHKPVNINPLQLCNKYLCNWNVLYVINLWNFWEITSPITITTTTIKFATMYGTKYNYLQSIYPSTTWMYYNYAIDMLCNRNVSYMNDKFV